EIFASPWVRQWVALETHNLRLTAERVRWMTGPGNLTDLESLCISDGADDDAVWALCKADLPRLKELAIHEVMRRTGWDDPLLTPAVVPSLALFPMMSRPVEDVPPALTAPPPCSPPSSPRCWPGWST